MKNVVIDDVNYEVIVDNNGLDVESLTDKITDYYNDFTYIVGDWAYGKVRLKGFFDDNDKRANQYNKISGLNDYIKNNCAYGCKWFQIKKIRD